MEIFNDLKSKIKKLTVLSNVIKRDMLTTIRNNGGHIGACCSSNDLLTVLYFSGLLKYNKLNPFDINRDYVLIRGYLGPLRYNIFSYLGWLNKDELSSFKKFGSILQGHEDMNLTPGVDITPSGSLGMLLSYSVGAAISFKKRNMDNRIWCFLGDGEEQEGNVSEAARHATNLNLTKIIVIIDKNNKQLSTSTDHTDKGINLKKIWKGYGWCVLNVNGHNISDIYNVYSKAIDLSNQNRLCIIANTIKGYEIEGSTEHPSGYHIYDNKCLNIRNKLDDEINNLTKIILEENINLFEHENSSKINLAEIKHLEKNKYLTVELNKNNGDSNDFLVEFLNKYSEINPYLNTYVIVADYPPAKILENGIFINKKINYINVGIREQHLFAMVHGIKTVEPESMILIIMGESFMYRCVDQINVLAQTNDHVIIYCTQSGLCGGKNGFTHQQSGVPGVFLNLENISIYEPSTKEDWSYSMNKAFGSTKNIQYIRTHSVYTTLQLNIKSKDFYSIKFGENPKIVIITNGLLFSDAYEAGELLYTSESLSSCIINMINLSNINGISDLLYDKHVIIFYNGNPRIISSMVSEQLIMSAIKIKSLVSYGYIKGTTGSIDELKKYFKLDKNGMIDQIKNVININ